MSRTRLLSELLDSIGARSWFGADSADQVRVDDLVAMCRRLVSAQGEASGVRLAGDILRGLRGLNDDDRATFFHWIAGEFTPDKDALYAAASRYTQAPGPTTLATLQARAEPPRQELFRRLNQAPGGTAELVRMREALLVQARTDPERLGPVDADLKHLFQSWFNRGFLVLRPIDWDTPASILEKIIRYEAVHEIKNWDQLRRRLAPADRRCFAFFHPAIPDDPLIFVEVALTEEIPASIEEVLDPDRPAIAIDEAQTAVFYSISNCHAGLAGVNFGAFLIKQVAQDLKDAIPSLKTFVTLSPSPTFARWTAALDGFEREALQANEKRALDIVAQADWANDPEKREAARPGLLALAARYYLHGQRADGRPYDPVARFHLGNGAILNRIMHWGDPSPAGIAQSHGVMVNYLYDLPKVEQRHEAYAASGAIAASRAVTGLLPSRSSAGARKDTA